ncbi:MAG: hypothetical protein U1F25_02390 [Rubrivivax sp.]
MKSGESLYELLGDAGPLACIVIHAGPGSRESLEAAWKSAMAGDADRPAGLR